MAEKSLFLQCANKNKAGTRRSWTGTEGLSERKNALRSVPDRMTLAIRVTTISIRQSTPRKASGV
jgi:hypothetical protein